MEKVLVTILEVLIWNLMGAIINVIYCNWVLKQDDIETNSIYGKIVVGITIIFAPLLLLEKNYRNSLKKLLEVL